MNLFRPPYGDYNNNLVGAARDCKYYTIQLEVDVYTTTLKPINTMDGGFFRVKKNRYLD